MDESTDVPLGKKVNNNHKLLEESIDEDPKVEDGYDDVNAQEVPVNNENMLVGGSKVTTTDESFPNVLPASRLLSEIKVQHKVDEISEVLNREPGNNEDKVKPEVENLKNELVPALANHVGQERSDDELPAINAFAEFQNNDETWSDGRVNAGNHLICYDVKEMPEEDDVVDECDNVVTENYDEDYVEVYDNLENVVKEEKHDYDETSDKKSVSLFNIVKEDEMLGNQETSDGGIAEDNEEVLEDFKGTTSRENDDQGSQGKENDDQGSLGEENDDQKNSINETDDHSNTDEEVPVNDEEMTEGNEDGNHNKTLKVMYEVSEDEGASSEEKEIKGEHPSPDVNADVALEDEERLFLPLPGL